MKYQHLTTEQRSQIYALKSTGHTQIEIARFLGVHKSTISRELQRNSGLRGYRAKQAQQLSEERQARVRRVPKSGKMTPENIAYIEDKLRSQQWSPEQISGVLRANGIFISPETLYRHVWKDKKEGGDLYQNLRHRAKPYCRRGAKNSGRGCIPGRVGIEERPKIVDSKRRIGDWEIDTVIGKNHQGVLVTAVERKSKFTRIMRVANKRSEVVTQALITMMEEFSEGSVKTLTFDNGKEFSQHAEVSEALGAKAYFARPYHSWERGLNEHTNGLIRQYLGKKTDFTQCSEEEIQRIEDLLNNRPRKVLKYLTPREVFEGRRRPQRVALAC